MSEQAKHRRVVVTGLGCVSSLGIGKDEFWKNLIAGKNGISRVEYFDTSAYERHFAGEVKGFDYRKYTKKKNLAMMGRASQMGYVAAKLAVEDAGMNLKDIQSNRRIGLCVGTTMGEAHNIENIVTKKVNDRKPSKTDVFFYPASSIPENLAHLMKISGQNLLFANACSAGNFAVSRAANLIKKNKADIMIAGGADAFSRIAFTGFTRLGAVSPEKCRPFDKNREGMIPGEGAAFLILESLESAQKRKADIYAEILGWGASSDAHHMTQPNTAGVTKAITKALKNANISYQAVDYINAHGTGTKENDKVECEAYSGVFTDALKNTPVSSTKSMLGHTMGSAAAFESIACCLAIKYGVIPPTINHVVDDPECPINCVPNKSIKKEVKIALNNSQAFGGNNMGLILSYN